MERAKRRVAVKKVFTEEVNTNDPQKIRTMQSIWRLKPQDPRPPYGVFWIWREGLHMTILREIIALTQLKHQNFIRFLDIIRPGLVFDDKNNKNNNKNKNNNYKLKGRNQNQKFNNNNNNNNNKNGKAREDLTSLYFVMEFAQFELDRTMKNLRNAYKSKCNEWNVTRNGIDVLLTGNRENVRDPESPAYERSIKDHIHRRSEMNKQGNVTQLQIKKLDNEEKRRQKEGNENRIELKRYQEERERLVKDLKRFRQFPPPPRRIDKAVYRRYQWFLDKRGNFLLLPPPEPYWFSCGQVKTIMFQLLSGLQEAQKCTYLHRDLKRMSFIFALCFCCLSLVLHCFYYCYLV